MPHIHVTGASGSGTTSLGHALAEALDIRHLDTDHFFWLPTDPPFTTPREVEVRIALLREQARPEVGWVLSGSAMKWGGEFEALYDLIVFLRIDHDLRMERVMRREIDRYGDRIGPGGDMAVKSKEFLEWAESYDTAGPERRSLVVHEAWLRQQTIPILRLDSSQPIETLLAEVLRHPTIKANGPPAS